METLKKNIQEVLEKDFTKTYDIISMITEGMKTADADEIETKIAMQLSSAIGRWTDARQYAHKSLTNLVRAAEDHKRYIESNFVVDSCFIDSSRFESYVTEAKIFEKEIATMLYMIDLNAADRSLMFEKISATIEWK
jgi:hypothetical protein